MLLRDAVCRKFSGMLSRLTLEGEFATHSQFDWCLNNIRNNPQGLMMCPVDKASNNFCYICVQYYLMLICERLGINVSDIVGNDVYWRWDEPLVNVFGLHEALCGRFLGKTFDVETSLPIINTTPNLHKNPRKFSFIAGARHSSVKPCALVLHVILRHFRCMLQRIS